MTPEHLAEIEQRLAAMASYPPQYAPRHELAAIVQDARALLAEVERLHAENAALREIVAAVADESQWQEWYRNWGLCAWCRSVLSDGEPHEDGCLVLQARKLLSGR